MRRLCLVDVGAIWWTCWHSSAEDDLSAARQRTIRLIERVVQADEYDHVALCLDSTRSVRREMVDTYKANREAKSPQSLDEMRKTIAALRDLGYHLFAADGWEGDDVIATFVAWAKRQDDIDTTIVGVDKDLFQLLGPGVEMHKFTDDSYFGEEGLREKLGIGPGQVADWLTLMGDKSDNIEGVKGVGAKTAAKLLAKYGSVDDMIKTLCKSPGEFTPALRTALIDAADDPNNGPLATAARLVALHDEILPDSECARVLEPMQPKSKGDSVPDTPPQPEDDWTDDRIAGAAPADTPAAAPSTPTAPPSRPEPPAEPVSEPRPKPSDPGKEKSRALALAGPFSLRLEPRDMTQAVWVAKKINESRLCARQFKNADECLMVVMAGAERGLGVWSAIKATHVIEGSLSWHAHYIIGEAKKHPDCEYFYLKHSDADSATYITKRRGTPEEESVTATIGDAEQAGLTKASRNGKPSNWVRIPKPMLRKEAGVQLARAVYPESTMGLYTPEEISDGRAVVDAEYEVVAA